MNFVPHLVINGDMELISSAIIQFLFKVDTFGKVTNKIIFKLLRRLNFRNNTKIIALYN